jgi:DNA-directed RNA polymerase specialized sigma subunit
MWIFTGGLHCVFKAVERFNRKKGVTICVFCSPTIIGEVKGFSGIRDR